MIKAPLISFEYLFVLLLCFSFVACDVNVGGEEASSTETEIENKAEPTARVTRAILLTNVDQLRLRKYGDRKSGMVTTFDENTPLYYTGESTDYEESIGGHKGPWMRVQSLDGDYEGWVFGANHFVEEWISKSQIDSLQTLGKDISIFSNLTKKEMSELTGANFDANVRGTRFSGFYQYNTDKDPSIIDGIVKLRARIFDEDQRDVSFIPCTLHIENGMPKTNLDCLEAN